MRFGIKSFFICALATVFTLKTSAETKTEMTLPQSRFVSDLRGFLSIDLGTSSYKSTFIQYQRRGGRIELRCTFPDEFKNSLSYLMRLNDMIGSLFQREEMADFSMAETLDPKEVPGVLRLIQLALEPTLKIIESKAISELPFAPRLSLGWTTRQELLSSYPQVFSNVGEVETAFAFYVDLLKEAFSGLDLIDSIKVSARHADSQEGSSGILATFSHTVKGVDLSGGKVMGPFYDGPIKAVLLARILGRRPPDGIETIHFERTPSGSIFHLPDGKVVWRLGPRPNAGDGSSAVSCQEAVTDLNKGKP